MTAQPFAAHEAMAATIELNARWSRDACIIGPTLVVRVDPWGAKTTRAAWTDKATTLWCEPGGVTATVDKATAEFERFVADAADAPTLATVRFEDLAGECVNARVSLRGSAFDTNRIEAALLSFPVSPLDVAHLLYAGTAVLVLRSGDRGAAIAALGTPPDVLSLPRATR